MTLNPKKLPPWMRKNKPDAQGKPPAPPPADSGQSDAELPPWLRDDFVPESKVKRIAPVNSESVGGDPPWLADIPEVEEPKSYKIGGMEISAEYLAGGDDLPDTLDSEMTFDAWMAEQEESKRVKDIEEEVPDLLTGINEFESDSSGTPDPKGTETGQLPDWFLGLEALDTRDAPDWFVNEDIPDAQSKPPSEIPPWISDMVIEDEEQSKPKAPPEDDFGSLLRSIDDVGFEEDAPSPDAWSFQTDAAEADAGAIPDDFFAQLTAAAPERAPMRAAPPPPPAAEDDEIPSFEDLFAGLGEPEAVDDLISGEPTAIDDMFAQLGSSAPPKLQPTLEDTEAVVEDFFAEIGDAPPQPSPRSWETSLPSQYVPEIDDFDSFSDDPDVSGGVEIPQIELDAFFDGVAAERSPSALDGDEIAEPDLDWFVTSEPEPEEPEVVEEEEPPLPPVDREDTMGWLSELNNIVTAVQRPLQPPPEEPVAYDTHRLSDFEIERAASEARSDIEDYEWPDPLAMPEAEPPEPEPESEPDPSDWLDAITPDDLQMLDDPPVESTPPLPRRSLLSERLRKAEQPRPRAVDIEDQIFQLPSGDPEQDAALPAHELQSGWLRDDLFTPEHQADDAPAVSDDFAVDELSAWASQQVDDLAALGDDFVLPDLPSWASQQPEFEPDAVGDSFVPPELPSWATQVEAEPEADDTVDELSAWASQQADFEPADFEPEPEAPAAYAEPDDDGDDEIDFFSLLETNADANVLLRTGQLRQLDEPTAPPQPDLSALTGEDSPDDTEMSEDDFYRSFGLIGDDDEADDKPSGASDDHFYASFNTGGMDDRESDDDDDFFASLGFDNADLFGEQGEQEPNASLDDDFFASLGLDTGAAGTPAADDTPLPNWMNAPGESEGQGDDDFFAAMGFEDERVDTAQPTYGSDEELLAALGMNRDDVDMPSARTPVETGGHEPTGDDRFDAVLGMIDAAEAQPTYTSDDELLAALGLGDENADHDSAADEIPDWATAQDEPEAETDFDSILGMVEEEPAQPAYESDEELLAALGLDSGDVADDTIIAEMPDWTRQPNEPEVEDFGSMFDEVEAELAWTATVPDEVEDELPPPDVTIEVQRTRPATDELPDWARLHYTQDEEEDLFGALKVTSRLPELPADDGLPDVADQPVEAGAADYDAIFGGMAAQQDVNAPLGDDLFSQWASQPDDELPQEEDFFAELGAVDAVAPQPAATDADDIDWGNLYEPVTPRAQDTFAPADENEAPPERQDLFAQWATEAEMPPTEDFFSALDMIEPESSAYEPADEEPDPLAWAQADVEAPPEEDFFAALGMIDDKPPVEPSAPGFTDIDSYLASLPTRQAADVPEPTGFGQPIDLDLDAILSGSVFEDEPRPKVSPFDLEPGMAEDWLAELHANVEEVSASAIVRQKEDRPVEELPSRLQRLRRLSEQVPDEAAPEIALNEALPGVPNALAPAPFVTATPGLVQGVSLTPEQQAKVDLLKALAPVDDAPKSFRMSAIEATYDSPFMADLEDTPETVLHPVKGDAPDQKLRVRRPRRKRQPIRIDRLLIVAVLAAAVILPFFVGGFRIGSLPPAHFAAGSPAQQVFDQMEAIPPGALVLVGLEYSPASAAELDGMTDALVRHILLRAAYPVIVSGNPLGLLRSANLIDSINDDAEFLARIGATEPLQANDDYYIVRYLPGGVIGLRAFSQDTANMLLTDIRGQASRLVVRSLREFALVVVITDRAEDLRTYAEQVAPLTDAPLVSALSYGAAPLAQPYADTLGGGLLVGLGDAYTYANTLGLATARDIAERIRIIPTETPSPTPAVTATPLPTTGEPTATTPPPTPTWTPEPLNATVISRQAVNMRSGPGTDNSVLAGVASGTTVLVLGFNDDGSWVNVQLEDGRSGWISVTLLEIHQGARANKSNHVPPRRQQIDEDGDPTATPRPPTQAVTSEVTVEITDEATDEATATRVPPTATIRPTRTPSPTMQPTSEVTAEATAEATPEIVAPSGSETGYRDERWYAVNLGIIASALIISVGAVVNVARGLLRRGRRR